MALPNIFTPEVASAVINRINQLTPETPPQWGKMRVDQMLAHCNVTYEMTLEDKHPRPNWVVRWLLQVFVKPTVTNEKPYRRNQQTAGAFRIKDSRPYEKEKNRLIGYIRQTQELGEAYFAHRKSPSFGRLTATEWNNLFYKHLDHHLTQFGV